MLYHNVDQFRLLATLWELARPGTMLALESTVTPLENRVSAAEAILEIRWDTKRVGNMPGFGDTTRLDGLRLRASGASAPWLVVSRRFQVFVGDRVFSFFKPPARKSI